MWCHYEAFTCFGIWQKPSLHTCREAKNSSSRMCASSVAWKESHCMVWGKEKHLYLNRSMCWFTELSPAGSVCACELLSSLSTELLAPTPWEVFVDTGCWQWERWLCLGLGEGTDLGTFWKREATKRSLKESFREQRGRTALLWSLGSKTREHDEKQEQENLAN